MNLLHLLVGWEDEEDFADELCWWYITKGRRQAQREEGKEGLPVLPLSSTLGIYLELHLEGQKL